MGSKDEVKHTCRWQVVTQPCLACTAAEDACVREFAGPRQGLGGARIPGAFGKVAGSMDEALRDAKNMAAALSEGIAVCVPAERTFTRAEVLTVLRARRAMMNTTASSDAARYNELGDLITIFERME